MHKSHSLTNGVSLSPGTGGAGVSGTLTGSELEDSEGVSVGAFVGVCVGSFVGSFVGVLVGFGVSVAAVGYLLHRIFRKRG